MKPCLNKGGLRCITHKIDCAFAHIKARLNCLTVERGEALSKGIVHTALPTQKTSGQTSVLLATEMRSMMFGRPSQTDDLTMIPGGGKQHMVSNCGAD